MIRGSSRVTAKAMSAERSGIVPTTVPFMVTVPPVSSVTPATAPPIIAAESSTQSKASSSGVPFSCIGRASSPKAASLIGSQRSKGHTNSDKSAYTAPPKENRDSGPRRGRIPDSVAASRNTQRFIRVLSKINHSMLTVMTKRAAASPKDRPAVRSPALREGCGRQRPDTARFPAVRFQAGQTANL